MERTPATESVTSQGEALAAVTNGIVGLFREYYGRGPTKAKSFLLDGYIVVCVLEDTMTTVEQTLVKNGNGDMVRQVRLTFQEAMADQFEGVVAAAMGRRVTAYHSQLTMEPDMGFEFFVLEEEG
ncbi:MAG TPA: Na-translocating system protein MpsC family protein [Thermoleophilaceae bacterium]|nr:Na-translocating system protein MpsC family protein [Thermoleophilaceae bacterium]